MNVRNSTTPNEEKRTDRDLTCQWNSIDLKKVRAYVNRTVLCVHNSCIKC